jgi:hypothetical protein
MNDLVITGSTDVKWRRTVRRLLAGGAGIRAGAAHGKLLYVHSGRR